MKNIITSLLISLLIFSSSCTKEVISKQIIEAEDMTLKTYFVEENPMYSGGKGLRNDGDDATGYAQFNFSGEPGLYTLKIRYVDEKEQGLFSTYKVSANNTPIAEWVANEELGFHSINESSLATKVIYNVKLNKNDLIKIEGTSTSGGHKEHARLDFVILEKQTETVKQIKIEAEEMDYKIYELEEKQDYSGGQGLIINKETNAFKTGTADYTFTGEEGYYNIDITYVDEDEHLAPGDKRFAEYALEIIRDGAALKTDAWIANKELGDHTINKKTLTVRHINGIGLKPNDIIRIKGNATGGEHAEHARVDCMVITLGQVSALRVWED